MYDLLRLYHCLFLTVYLSDCFIIVRRNFDSFCVVRLVLCHHFLQLLLLWFITLYKNLGFQVAEFFKEWVGVCLVRLLILLLFLGQGCKVGAMKALDILNNYLSIVCFLDSILRWFRIVLILFVYLLSFWVIDINVDRFLFLTLATRIDRSLSWRVDGFLDGWGVDGLLRWRVVLYVGLWNWQIDGSLLPVTVILSYGTLFNLWALAILRLLEHLLVLKLFLILCK